MLELYKNYHRWEYHLEKLRFENRLNKFKFHRIYKDLFTNQYYPVYKLLHIDWNPFLSLHMILNVLPDLE